MISNLKDDLHKLAKYANRIKVQTENDGMFDKKAIKETFEKVFHTDSSAIWHSDEIVRLYLEEYNTPEAIDISEFLNFYDRMHRRNATEELLKGFYLVVSVNRPEIKHFEWSTNIDVKAQQCRDCFDNIMEHY